MKEDDVEDDQPAADQLEAEKLGESKKKGKKRGEAVGMEEDLEENLLEGKSLIFWFFFISLVSSFSLNVSL